VLDELVARLSRESVVSLNQLIGYAKGQVWAIDMNHDARLCIGEEGESYGLADSVGVNPLRLEAVADDEGFVVMDMSTLNLPRSNPGQE
jgi:hypothetical protein